MMGAWGEEPWANDAAADWLGTITQTIPVDKIEAAFVSPPPSHQGIDEARAACYLLQCFGRSVHLWPGNSELLYGQLIPRAIAYLENVINPPDETWSYTDGWTDRPAIEASLEEQLVGLRQLVA